MDKFLRDLLKEKNKNNSLAVDEILGKIQKRTLSVMGPLSKVWLKLENAKKSDAPPLSLDKILSLLEQTICLLGQTSNSILYHRRYNILLSVCSPQEIKNMLKKKVELLQSNDENLFGKEFSDHLTESVKSKKSSKEVFLKLDDSKKPFRSGTSFQQQQCKSGGQKQITTDNRGNRAKQNWSWSRKDTDFQGGDRRFQGKSINNSTVSRCISPVIKRLFSKEIITNALNIPPAGRISHFLVNWQKLTLNQDILSVVKGYKIPFIKIPFQRKIPNFTKMNKKQIALVDLELKEMLRKGAIMRTQPAHVELLSNLFLVKKGGGYRLVINLKMLNHFIPFLHFTMEGPSRLKHIMHGGDWMCKLELKDAYFSVPLDRNSRTFVRFQWKGTLRVHVPLFWTGPSTKGVVKIIEISHLRKIIIRVIIYLDDMLILSHIIREAQMSRDSHISPAEFVLYNKCKEINFAPMSKNRISGNGDRFNQNDH